MEPAVIRKAIVWAVAAFLLTVIHPLSFKAGLAITIVAAIVGAIN